MKILSIIFIFSVWMSAFGQGITCDIPYNPKINPLSTSDVIPNSGIIIPFDSNTCKDAIYWNLPVSVHNEFNFFAAELYFKNRFADTQLGKYSFLEIKDKGYKNYPKDPFWNFESKPEGNNLVDVNGSDVSLTLGHLLPIYVIQSKRDFYKSLKLPYNEIINKTSNWQPLSEYISRKILEKNYLTQYKEKVINLSGNIKFTDSVSIESNSANSGNDNLIRHINGHLSEWAKMYQPFSKEENFPIHCNKGFIISLKKESISERKSFYELNEKSLTNGNKFKGIFDSEFKIPKKAFCNIENSKISISIDSETKNEEKVYLKSIFIPRSINLYPTLAFTGMSHYLILKQNHRKKFIPVLTIGSVGVFALAWGTKELFYKRYLEQPNTRTNSYITANTSYNIMKVAILTYAVGVSLDLYKTCQSIKRLTRLVNEVNPKI